MLGEIVSGISKVIGFLFRLIEAPGIMLHECAHLYFCSLTKTKVIDYRLLDLDAEVGGWVNHEEPDHAFEQFMISFGPFAVNSVGCISVVFAALWASSFYPAVAWFLFYIAFVVAMHAIPSFQDVHTFMLTTIWDITKGKILSIVLLPLGVPIYVLAFLMHLIPKLNFAIRGVFALFLIGSLLNISDVPIGFNMNDRIKLEIYGVPDPSQLVPGLSYDDRIFLIEGCERDSGGNIACVSGPIDKEVFMLVSFHSFAVLYGSDCLSFDIPDSDLRGPRSFFGKYSVYFGSGNSTTSERCSPLGAIKDEYILG